MITEWSLAIYKTKPAIVKERGDGKYTISLADGEQVKVRDKDIEIIHPGPVKDFSAIKNEPPAACVVREAWELLLSDEENTYVTLKDLASLVGGEYTPSSAYTAYCLIKDGLYFSGSIDAIVLKSKDEIDAEETKRNASRRELTERLEFLGRLKTCLKKSSPEIMLSDDIRFMQDVEALCYGKSAKSRTLKELELGETPEEAHGVLLKTGFWNGYTNPHPCRFGLTLAGATICPGAPSLDNRQDLCHLEAFAIDSPWSNDPDDAISIETSQDCALLYVHVADPAATITFDSPAEKEARDRGATLYLPEGTARMLAEESLPLFALGLSEKSCALTFKMTVNCQGEVTKTEIFPSIVKARRITYEEADSELETNPPLRAIFELSQKIFNRRTSHGAVNIDFPDVHITVENKIININPMPEYKSASVVKECMIAAGEGAGTWAASRGLAFPYISQEVELQGAIAKSGLAASYQLRRCMRPRVLSVKPGRHQGLGLDTYTQVTSPLRRYTDLLAHIQIRAFLHSEKTLTPDEISARLGYCEAAALAAVQAERASNNHWTMVYLCDKKDSVWDAVALENKGNRWAVIIPSLALETQVSLQKDASPNDRIKLVLKSANIAKGEAVFVQRS